MSAKIPGGYILLARKTLESELMDKPPLYVKLWAWMLLKANFKDRDKLKRGQFVASISDMQEAMSYHIGYRKITPSRAQIRNSYEAFVKRTMISTAKTTRGMIITICNYDQYQNPKNYEAHNETHNENSTKRTATTQDTEECIKNEKKGIKTFMSDSDEIRLSELLYSLMLKNNPKAKKPNIQSWAKTMDLIIRRDGRTPGEIEKLIRWTQDDDFEMTNVLSPGKLRKRFDQLWLKMEKEKINGSNSNQIKKRGQSSSKYSGLGTSMPAAR